MVVTELFVWWEHWESISEFLWKQLDLQTVITIEETFRCCSFNGTDTWYTWAADIAEFANCTATYSWDPMETCWRKLYDAMNKRDEDSWNGKTWPQLLVIANGVPILVFFFVGDLLRKVELQTYNNAIRRAQGQTSVVPVELCNKFDKQQQEQEGCDQYHDAISCDEFQGTRVERQKRK